MNNPNIASKAPNTTGRITFWPVAIDQTNPNKQAAAVANVADAVTILITLAVSIITSS
jgi:hypothetical protein